MSVHARTPRLATGASLTVSIPGGIEKSENNTPNCDRQAAFRLAVYDGQTRIGSLVQIGRTVALWTADDLFVGIFGSRHEAIGALPKGGA